VLSRYSGQNKEGQLGIGHDYELNMAANYAYKEGMPITAVKVNDGSDLEGLKFSRIVTRKQRLYALTSMGDIYHWGQGYFIPRRLEATEGYTASDVAISDRGVIIALGTPPELTDKAVDKTLLEKRVSEQEAAIDVTKDQLIVTQVPYGVEIRQIRGRQYTLGGGEEIRLVAPGKSSLDERSGALR